MCGLLFAGAGPGDVTAREITILLTNDDGIAAPGIVAVRDTLRAAGHRVIVVAPREDQSGSSVRISTKQVGLTQDGPDTWIVDGTPADSTLVALRRILRDAPPDLVVSGANRGQNLGVTSNVSGTVGAAIMAAMHGIPAVAVSVGLDMTEAAAGFPSTVAAYPAAARFVSRLVGRLAARSGADPLLAKGTVLNVNYPALPVTRRKPARWTVLSRNFGYGLSYPDGPEPNTVKVAFASDDSLEPADANTDLARFRAGYITLTLLDTSWLAPVPAREALAARLGDIAEP
jgi:5'/3'-nucleotidase SurE